MREQLSDGPLFAGGRGFSHLNFRREYFLAAYLAFDGTNNHGMSSGYRIPFFPPISFERACDCSVVEAVPDSCGCCGSFSVVMLNCFKRANTCRPQSCPQ